MSDSQKNALRSVTASALRAIALLCCTGPVMQIFLSSLGFSSQSIYLHTTIVQGANVLTIFLCSQWADRGDLVRRTVLSELPHALLYLCYIPLCLRQAPGMETFWLLTLICLTQSVCVALFTICGYKLPYYIYHPAEYGSVLAVSGLLSSVLSLVTGAAISWLLNYLTYGQLMLYASAVSAGLMLLSALLHWRYRPIPQPEESPGITGTPLKSPASLLKYPLFLYLIPANFLRGFGYGTMSVMATIALELGLGESISVSLVSIQAIATILGCLGFTIFTHKISMKNMILLGSLTFLALPLILTGKVCFFYAAFAAAILGRTLVEYAVPSLLRYAVNVEIAGPFNAWRMLLHNAGTMAATAVAAVISTEWLLIITVAAQLIAGLSYYFTKQLGQEVPNTPAKA